MDYGLPAIQHFSMVTCSYKYYTVPLSLGNAGGNDSACRDNTEEGEEDDMRKGSLGGQLSKLPLKLNLNISIIHHQAVRVSTKAYATLLHNSGVV